MRSARWNEDVQGRLLLLGEIAVLRMQRNENEPSNDKRRDTGPSGISCPLFNLQEPLVNVPIRRRSSCFSGPLPGAMTLMVVSNFTGSFTSEAEELLTQCVLVLLLCSFHLVANRVFPEVGLLPFIDFGHRMND